MKTITLSNEVMVSDPGYSSTTWCQHKLTNVLPGEYHCKTVMFNVGLYGQQCSFIIVVHKDYNTDKKLHWRRIKGITIGVDSGQAGIFSMETYRNDEIFLTGKSEHTKKYGIHKEDVGEEWYGHMCDLTDFYKDKWGTYPNGIVSRSGHGDGAYGLRVAKHKGKVIGMVLDFGIEELNIGIIEMIRQSELLGDVCGICGEDNVDSISCNCKM